MECWNGSGVGILSVDSLEELDAIMAEFPLEPFGEVEIFPLADLTESFQCAKQSMAKRDAR